MPSVPSMSFQFPFQVLAEHPDVDKVAFTGSTDIGKVLRRATAGTGKKISLELGGKSPVIVYDSADLDSAVESVVDAIWFNQGQVCSAGSKLLVQQPVFDKFIAKLKTRLGHFRIGKTLDKTIDMAAIVDESQRKSVAEFVEEARAEGAEVFQTDCPPGCFYPPTLVTGVNTCSRIVMEEVFGPVLVAIPFRTAKEALALANNTLYFLSLLRRRSTSRLARSGSTATTCLTLPPGLEGSSNLDSEETAAARDSLSM